RQQNHKFIAAVAKRKIDQAAMCLQGAADFRQQSRANQVPVRVVDLLEVVEIDEHQGELVVVALRTVNLRLQDKAHVPRVIQRGAIVGDGQLVDALHVARVFQGNRGKVRQRFQQIQIARIESFWPKAIDEFDYPQAGVKKLHWDRDDGLRFHLGLFVALA